MVKGVKTPSRKSISPKRKSLTTPKRKSTTPKKQPTTAKLKTKKTTNFTINNKVFKLNFTTIKEIRRLQLSTNLCIPKLPFSRLIREVLMDVATVDMRVERQALHALQEACEIYVTQIFEDSNRCASHAGRITVFPKDMKLVLDLRGPKDPGYNFL